MNLKEELINYFREKAGIKLRELESEDISYKDKASEMNKFIIDIRKEKTDNILSENISKEERLNKVLLLYYSSYIVMLESRNKVWPYDYMTFSRRIGELWEPFCKLPFIHIVREDVELYEPMRFVDLQNELTEDMNDLVMSLDILDNQKEDIINKYNIVWEIVDSGGIKLGLDLHLKIGDEYYDIDYKSGFSSNEKGNTNRLLLVGSLFNSLEEVHNTLLFVRQIEEENNHYLTTLSNSKYWNVYCASNAYNKIHELSGFDLKEWIENNIDWVNDITVEFKDHLVKNNLLGYLSW